MKTRYKIVIVHIVLAILLFILGKYVIQTKINDFTDRNTDEGPGAYALNSFLYAVTKIYDVLLYVFIILFGSSILGLIASAIKKNEEWRRGFIITLVIDVVLLGSLMIIIYS